MSNVIASRGDRLEPHRTVVRTLTTRRSPAGGVKADGLIGPCRVLISVVRQTR